MKVNPDDYYEYEEQFYKESGGGGSKKSDDKKGKKTLKEIKREQTDATENKNKNEAEESIKKVIDSFPEEEGFVGKYLDCVNSVLALAEMPLLKNEELEFKTAKSSGPGGQHVNKRETKVILIHKPTNIKVEYSETRNQERNKEKAHKLLEKRIIKHIKDWKTYLNDSELTKDVI
jgi:hypothetical protein